MLILWQDQVAEEAHAEAVASAEVHSVAAQGVAQAVSVAALLVVHTAVVSETHTMEVLSVVIMVDILEDIITIITDHTSGVQGAEFM